MIHHVDILSIKLSFEKGKDRVQVSQATLKENFGIENDAYAKPGDREVCLMTLKTQEDLKEFTQGLCVKRFSESLLIDCDPEEIKIGDRIDFGGPQVEVTKLGKKCYLECMLIQKGIKCPLSQYLMFAKVIKGGEISVKS